MIHLRLWQFFVLLLTMNDCGVVPISLKFVHLPLIFSKPWGSVANTALWQEHWRPVVCSPIECLVLLFERVKAIIDLVIDYLFVLVRHLCRGFLRADLHQTRGLALSELLVCPRRNYWAIPAGRKGRDVRARIPMNCSGICCPECLVRLVIRPLCFS